MVIRRFFLILTTVGFLLAATGCDSGGANGIGPVILITNQWYEEGNPEHEFQLNSPDDNRSEGAFSGTETVPQNGSSDFNDLVGFWSDGYIQFTVNRQGDEVRYTGEFDHENQKRLEFTSSEGDLVIVRD